MKLTYNTVLIVLAAVLSKLSSSVTSGSARNGKCQPLEIASCKKLGYNETRPLEDMYRSTPMQELQQYIKMIDQIRCSPDALLFLCTVYSPACFEEYTVGILPCRSFCERVRRGCLPFVKMGGYSWPSELDCRNFPEYNTGVCFRPSAIVTTEGPMIDETGKNCTKCKPRQALKRYKQFKGADYVIEAEVKSRITTGEGKTKVIVKVKRVFKKRATKIGRGMASLISPTKCLCPEVEFDKAVIIVGYENKQEKKLSFDDRSIVMTSSRNLKRRLRKWSRKYKRYLARKSQKARKQKTS